VRLRTFAIACVVASLGAAAPAWGHGDPSGHYLETDPLYPSFADRPSQALELQLLGLLQAVRRDGYPVKVALVGGKDDVADTPAMLRHPQRYADFLVSELEAARPVTAPLLVITPHGVGVAGRAMRGEVYGPVTPAAVPTLLGPLAGRRPGDGDALAQTAIAAVRRVARPGGHPLPADVPPARTIAGAGGPSSARAAADDTSLPGWLPFAVFAAVFLLAWLGYELRMRAPGRPHRPAVN
jgi:hypothetical protein